jgi:hypothetical protein
MYSSLSLVSLGFMLILSVAHAATLTSIRGIATSLPALVGYLFLLPAGNGLPSILIGRTRGNNNPRQR